MRNKYIISTLLITLLASIALSFMFSEKSKFIENLTNIIECLSSLITLIIALSLYTKYGIEKSLIEKQTDIIIQFLQELGKLELRVRTDSMFGPFNPLNTKSAAFEPYYYYTVVFSIDDFEYMNKLKIYTKDPFMPKGIAKKIACIVPSNIYNRVEKEDKDIIKLFVRKSRKSVERIEPEYFKTMNGKTFTLIEYIEYWDIIVEDCKKSISENSMSKFELNL